MERVLQNETVQPRFRHTAFQQKSYPQIWSFCFSGSGEEKEKFVDPSEDKTPIIPRQVGQDPLDSVPDKAFIKTSQSCEFECNMITTTPCPPSFLELSEAQLHNKQRLCLCQLYMSTDRSGTRSPRPWLHTRVANVLPRHHSLSTHATTTPLFCCVDSPLDTTFFFSL